MGGYVIPKELRSEKDAYIFSFVNRTKKNLEYINRIAQSETVEGKKGKSVTVYEVTQLINSMRGLVIFPKEAFWEKVVKYGNGQYASEEFKKIIREINSDPLAFKYVNTYLCKNGKNAYSKGKYECLTVLNFIRHFRNALSHEKISVYPYEIDSDEDIKGFVFEDENKIKILDKGDKYVRSDSDKAMEYNQQFTIQLTVKQINKIAISICDMFMAVAKDTYGIKEDINNFY